MSKQRWLVAGLILLSSGVQAWRSQLFHSTPLVIALVGVAVAGMLYAALVVKRHWPMLGVVVACVALLVTAKVISPVPVVDLTLILSYGLPLFAVIVMQEGRGARCFRRSAAPPDSAHPA